MGTPIRWDPSLLWIIPPACYWCLKWSCQHKCATSFHLGAPYLCMATTLEVYSCHHIRETTCHIVLKDLHPPLGNPQTYHNCSPFREKSKSLQSLILFYCHFTNLLVKQWKLFALHDSPFKTFVPFLRCWSWKLGEFLA
jgi:hypothetical protein